MKTVFISTVRSFEQHRLCFISCKDRVLAVDGALDAEWAEVDDNDEAISVGVVFDVRRGKNR